METMRPKYRYLLKSAIIAKGYKNVGEFGKATDLSSQHLSYVINGWKFPGPKAQRTFCKSLEIGIEELEGLLTGGKSQ